MEEQILWCNNPMVVSGFLQLKACETYNAEWWDGWNAFLMREDNHKILFDEYD